MKLVNMKKMLAKAYKEKYAIPHININNLEWAKITLLTAEERKSPIIVAFSPKTIEYVGGYHVAAWLIKNLIWDLNISVPVALHLDHGNYDECLKAIEAGFSSIMYDGSCEEFKINCKNTKALSEIAKKNYVSLEVEIGKIGGCEDNKFVQGAISNLEEVKEISKLDICCLAIGINNFHGEYPKDWNGLDFELLKKINAAINLPLVLHGGSQIPEEQIIKSIGFGISKININTELQIVYANALKEYMEINNLDENRNYDPRKINKFAMQKMKEVLIEKFKVFNSINKAK